MVNDQIKGISLRKQKTDNAKGNLKMYLLNYISVINKNFRTYKFALNKIVVFV